MKSLILVFALLVSTQMLAETVDRILAVVNTELVTESDLRSFSKRLEKSNLIDDLLLFGKSLSELKKSRADQLEYLINERLLESEVKRMNLSVTQERVTQEIGERAKANGMNTNDLLATIKQHGESVSDYQAFIKSRIERQSLIVNEISSKIKVGDEEVLAQYMKNNPNAGSGIFEYSLAHIYFNPKKGGAEAAISRAEAVLQKIKSGESFDVIAEQTSEDSNFAAGGFLGNFKAGEFSKEFEQAISKLNSGDVSNVVKSKDGFHILKINAKKIVSDPNFEKQKEKIRNDLIQVAFDKNFRNWLTTKREDSFIKINK